MATNEIDDLEFWRFRAEEVCSIADDMKVVEAKAIMTRIAEDYERIADLVERRLRERKQRLSGGDHRFPLCKVRAPSPRTRGK